MSRTLPIVIGLAIAGLIGAVVGPLMNGPEPPPATTVARAETDPRILRELEQLRERLDAIERLAPMRSLPSEVAVAEPGTPEDEAVETAPALPDVNETALAEKVEKVIAEREQKQREEQGRRMSDWVKQRESRVLDDLAENHGLTPHQRGEMEKLLERRRKAYGEFFGNMFGRGGTRGTADSGSNPEQPADMAAIRDKVESIRAETDEQMKTLLSPTQYDAFKEQDRMGMGGMGGMGRGGPPRGTSGR